MTPRLIEAFWKTVAGTLIELYGIDQPRALAMIEKLKQDVSGNGATPRTRYSDLVYHSQPLQIASDLVGTAVPPDSAFIEKYQQIERRNLRYKSRSKTQVLAPRQPEVSEPLTSRAKVA